MIYLNQGKATFKDLIFIGPIGKTSFFEIKSNALSKSESLQVDFRDCVQGEISSNSKCEVCPTGKYSLNFFATECNSCFKNAKCDGGNKVNLD